MTSLTSTPHGVRSGARHGRSRASEANHPTTASTSSPGCAGATRAGAGSGEAGTASSCITPRCMASRGVPSRATAGSRRTVAMTKPCERAWKEAAVNTVLRPVGPEPARVYWTRRLVLFGALIVAATLVWTLIQGGGTPSDAKAGASPTSESSEAAADAEEPTGAAAPCAAEHLELAVESGRSSYADGARASFAITVTNTGEAGCTVDVGEASRELLVTSGTDRIWSSLDCDAGEDASRNLLLGAGKSDTHDATWARIRSDEKCSEGLPTPRPGTYKAQVRLNGAKSELATFVLE